MIVIIELHKGQCRPFKFDLMNSKRHRCGDMAYRLWSFKLGDIIENILFFNMECSLKKKGKNKNKTEILSFQSQVFPVQ